MVIALVLGKLLLLLLEFYYLFSL